MTGDKDDILYRIKATLPRWFGDNTPVLDALITGFATAWANAYSLYLYVKDQTRIATATGGWLDMISADFFGTALPRKTNEQDTLFRARILAALLREKGTRYAIRRVLLDLTGREPVIVEPMRPADTGGYGIALGYGLAGAYGSMLVHHEAFIVAYRPIGSGIPLVSGYGVSTGAYGTPSRASYASIDDIEGSIDDADIYEAIESVKPSGTRAWVAISS